MAEGISAFKQGGLYREVGGSYIRILRSDSAIFGGRGFVTLIFGEEPPGAGAPPLIPSREEEAFWF